MFSFVVYFLWFTTVLHLWGTLNYMHSPWNCVFGVFSNCLLTVLVNWRCYFQQIGVKWEKVLEKISLGHYQPLLLLYQRKHLSLINTDMAPKQTTVVQNFVRHLMSSETGASEFVFVVTRNCTTIDAHVMARSCCCLLRLLSAELCI